MRNQKKHPNASKHGVFNRMTIVPGEDEEEFEALHADLVSEWAPSGTTEDDAVFSIAQAIWRKRRVQNFIDIQVSKNMFNKDHPSYDEYLALKGFVVILRGKPADAEEHARRCLRPAMIRSLQRKVPPSEFKSATEWAQALINEIETVLLPERKPECKTAEDHTAEQIGSLILSAASFTNELFNQELMLDERLDTMIDRAVKRLVQTKALKQALDHTRTERTEDQYGKVVKIGRIRR
jgi:hypothetical protein